MGKKTVGNATGQGQDISVDVDAGVTTADTQRMVIVTDQTSIPVTDNGGSITVDGTVAVTGVATAAKQPALGTAGVAATDVITVQGIASGVAQPVSGTVTANAGTGPFPVSDNAGSLTVDAPVATPVFVRLSDGSAAITTLPVSIATAPVLVAGAAVIGKVGIDQTTPGTTNLVALAANQSVNNAQVNGITVQTGVGASGTGTQRVAVASDSSIVLAAGAATIGALTANQSVNQAQVAGVATATGVGASNTGTQRVATSTDSTIGTVTTVSTVTSVTAIGTSVTPGTSAAHLGKAEDAVHTTGDTGVMMLGVRADAVTAPTSTDGDYGFMAIDKAGNTQVVPGRCTTATLSNVASSATSVSLLASDTSRKGVIVYNDSTQVLYLKYGATASTSSFTYYLAAGATWEMPSPIFTGALDGIWASANGNARITLLAA